MRVRCEGIETKVYALLGQGFTVCFCNRNLARELPMSDTNQQLTRKLQTLTKTKSYRTVSAEMEVRGLFDEGWIQLPDVTAVDEILWSQTYFLNQRY